MAWKVEPWLGMVRVSFGLYNNSKDIDALIYALTQIITKKDYYRKQYLMNKDGEYKHKEFNFSSKDFFSLTGTIDKDITSK